jgi:hypothetical protein
VPSYRPAARHRAGRPGAHALIRRRRWPWITALVLAVVIGVPATIVGVFAYQALTVRNDLLAAKDEITAIADSVKSGHTDTVAASGKRVTALTENATQIVRGDLWTQAAKLPGIGVNVTAIRKATEATNILVEGAMPSAVDILSGLQLKNLTVAGGGIDLEPFVKADKGLPKIEAAFVDAKSEMSGIDRKKILPFVDGAIGTLFDVMDQAGPALTQIKSLLPILLHVSGSEGPRTYMLIFQNNAEIRAQGGLPAATAIVSVDDGHVKLDAQTGTASFPRDKQVITVPKETASLYDADTFTGFGNFTRTPNFVTTAKAFDSLWNISRGGHLDGVISLDPVVLSYILKVTGPITLSNGDKLTSGNAVKSLLYETYIRYTDNDVQDAYFSEVAAQVFAKISSGGWSPGKMLTQLEKAQKEDRLLAWFAQPDEQALVVKYGLDGQMATDNTQSTEVGIFLNNASYSKLDYFLRSKVDMQCDANARTVTTTISITNTITTNDEMTDYQLGIRNIRYGISRRTLIEDVMLSAPPGGKIVSNTPKYGNDWSRVRTGEENGRPAKTIRVFVPSGKTVDVSYTVHLPDGDLGPLSLRTTPTVSTTPTTIDPSCGALTTLPTASPTPTLSLTPESTK